MSPFKISNLFKSKNPTTPKMVSGTATAKVNGVTIAEATEWEVVEGNIYFPPSSLKQDQAQFTKTSTASVCPWKGTASYYTITVDGKELKDAAWFYATPKDKAENIKDHVAFYKTKVDITSS
ncbi:MAG: hypothetical protein M1829_000827 [Trizodia sp. TS-e1964]|nr:MAG: hypothetical protein M1829_000827 [Trizodia sp. TS-e1964]